ncbi:phosphatase PAP2 family protein [Pseudidiomarina salilacus]|uniref:phosphatase PAP2 family protein n=1 Tax=Pseudidiomarina salilacus TaxID=3384452 RepID=UPI00398489A4
MGRWLATLSRYDQQWFCWLTQRAQSIQQQRWVRWLSRSGDGYCYAIVALYFYFTDELIDRRMLPTLFTGFAIEIPTFMLIKRWLKRPRPYQTLSITAVIQAHDQFSFPSGHTTAAFLFATLACYFMPHLAPVWLCWATAVGLSRLLLGVHYPGDILAGAALGTGLAGIALSLMDPITI